MNKEEIKKQVRKRYGRTATTGSSCCGPSACGCGQSGSDKMAVSQKVGYELEDLARVLKIATWVLVVVIRLVWPN